MSLEKLHSQLLKEAYNEAEKRGLSSDFIKLLRNELIRRNIHHTDTKQ